jgi:glycerol-3-phosphate dehydrogenase
MKKAAVRLLLLVSLVGLVLVICSREGPPEPDLQPLIKTLPTQALPTRTEVVENELKNNTFDLLIIGGGATCSGIALEAATRGLKVALVEAEDFASQTSSRSTKLIHGGVRYLENAVKKLDHKQYQLVKDALAERMIFLKNAPHLSNKIALVTPVYSWFEAAYYLVGLKSYDWISGSASFGSSEFVSAQNSVERFPWLKKENLKGSVLYYDGQFDDARMSVSLALTATKYGATVLNYARVISLEKASGRLVGAKVLDQRSGQEIVIRAKGIINATGAFADGIRKMDEPTVKPMIEPSSGAHILLAGKFSTPSTGVLIPKTEDGRVLFLLPWQNKTLVGTTDIPTTIRSHPKATEEEVEYILSHLREHFAMDVARKDVLAVWSGIRPLAKSTSTTETAQVSRDHLIEVSQSGLVTIAGGKWTTYRKMALDATDRIIEVAGLKPARETLSSQVRVIGGDSYTDNFHSELAKKYSLPEDISVHLARTYGDRAETVLSLAQGDYTRLVEGNPYLKAEVIHALRNEYATSAADFLARRIRLAFLDSAASAQALPHVVSIMAKELGLSEEWQREEMKRAQKELATMI